MSNTKIDLHCHSKFSFDSDSELDNICSEAIRRGIGRIAITDHCDIDCDLAGLYDKYDASSAKDEVLSAKEHYADRLYVTYAIELGGAHICTKEADALVSSQNFEFVLGSLHNLRNVPDFYFMDFGKMPDALINHLMKRNIDELCEIACLPFIHSIAHITYPYRYIKRFGRTLKLERYYKDFAELFNIIISTDKALEVNTSPYRNGLYEPMPEKELLELYYSVGGRNITMGSDAHTPEGLGDGISEAAAMLIDIGFDSVSYFENGDRKQQPLSLLI